jgi:hypothetical protein
MSSNHARVQFACSPVKDKYSHDFVIQLIFDKGPDVVRVRSAVDRPRWRVETGVIELNPNSALASKATSRICNVVDA